MPKKSENLKILLLTTDIGLGGAERVWNEHSVAFSKYFHVEQAVFELNNSKPGYRSHLLLHDLTIHPQIFRLGSLARFIQRAVALYLLVRRRKFDIVISHLEGANLVNVVSCSPAKKILVLHGSAQGDLNHKKLYKFLRLHFLMPFIYRQGDAVVGVSQGTADEIRRYSRISLVHTIPNFFDSSLIQEQATSLIPDYFASIFNGRPILIASGRLAKQKNHSFLLKTLQVLKSRNRDVCLVIMGDGDLRDSLIELAEHLQLKVFSFSRHSHMIIDDESDVYFVGYQHNPFAWLSKSNLFLFPSLWEGHPLALCEALICKIPVVSADCPNGPREILSPHEHGVHPISSPYYASNGVLMPLKFDDAASNMWANVIENLISDPHVCNQFAESGFLYTLSLSAEHILPRWLDLISNITDKY